MVSPRYLTWTIGLPPWSTTLNGQDSTSFLTIGSSNRRPINRLETLLEPRIFFSFLDKTNLTSKTVFSGFMAAWFLAASPMRRSSSVKETKEGVVKLPCSLATAKQISRVHSRPDGPIHTDFDIVALVVGNTGVGGTCLSRVRCCTTTVKRSQKPSYPDRCRWHHRKLRQPWSREGEDC